MTLQVLAPGMPHVLSEGLHAQDIVRVKLLRTLPPRTAFLQQICHIVAMRCGRHMVKQPQHVRLGGEMIKFGPSQDVPFVDSLGNRVLHRGRLLLIFSHVPSSSLSRRGQMASSLHGGVACLERLYAHEGSYQRMACWAL